MTIDQRANVACRSSTNKEQQGRKPRKIEGQPSRLILVHRSLSHELTYPLLPFLVCLCLYSERNNAAGTLDLMHFLPEDSAFHRSRVTEWQSGRTSER